MFPVKKLLVAVTAFATSMSGIGIGLFLAFNGFSTDNLLRASGITGFAGIAAVGYGFALWLFRHHLRPDARIGGRRDFIAGILAVVLLLVASIATQGAPMALRLALCLFSGSCSAVLTHFPWFQRHAQRADVHAVRADA